ncbi:DNA helicase [Roseibium sp. RKSG952]|uniref:DNA helicase n=1 Tax=Roseibium sp. RKSG952 TaxID=2529384 RepID=UPI0012BC7A2F|nr:DNA helicase [Roseibium sp. RKSG952]MTH94979.1 DNA helicase [Roseibium sp. RKSG952]
MRLSAPIYRLKQQAKSLSKQRGIALNIALDHMARKEGFNSWGHPTHSARDTSSSSNLLSHFRSGDTVLLGARPGHGKTMLGLELALSASKNGDASAFFSLEYTLEDIRKRLNVLSQDQKREADKIHLDLSDDICAEYVIKVLKCAPDVKLIVVDYLQLLDLKRSTPPLDHQVRALRAFARSEQKVMVLISQIDRSFETKNKTHPDLSDVRMPNPLDLSLFSKTCFLHDGTVEIRVNS